MPHAPIWAILPVKPFDDAKSRLQPVMDAGQRRDLARALMLHSLATLQACDLVDHVLIVSSDNDALEAAAVQGAAVLQESGTGLNPALEEARRHAIADGASGLLVLASDLPLLDLSDVDAMLATGQEASIVIAPDRRRQGTNALLLRPAGSIEFSFGESSYERHLDLAAAAGLHATEVYRTGLAFDIDLPRDWHDLMSSGWEGLPGLRLVWTRA